MVQLIHAIILRIQTIFPQGIFIIPKACPAYNKFPLKYSTNLELLKNLSV